MDFVLGPDERLSVFVVGFDVGIDVLLELFDGGERCAAQRLALQDREPDLDLIEPRRAGRREVEMSHWDGASSHSSFFLWVLRLSRMT